MKMNLMITAVASTAILFAATASPAEADHRSRSWRQNYRSLNRDYNRLQRNYRQHFRRHQRYGNYGRSYYRPYRNSSPYRYRYDSRRGAGFGFNRGGVYFRF